MTGAHLVRLESNNERHSDEELELPSAEDAEAVFDFAMAFAEYLFVLPAKVERGIIRSGKEE